MRRFRHRFITWLAIVAAMLVALVPTVSRAAASAEGARYLIDFCSAAGTRSIALGGIEAARDGDAGSGSGGAGAERALSLDRCPHCCAHAGVAAPPPSNTELVLPSPDSAPLPRLFVFEPRPSSSWPSSRPRAPPLRA